MDQTGAEVCEHVQVLEILNDNQVWLLREGAQPVAYSQEPDAGAKNLREERNARWAWVKTAVDPRAAT